MEMELKTWEDGYVRYCQQLVPNGWAVLAEHTPCSSTTPWDYYALCWFRPRLRALADAGIDASVCETIKTIIHPSGTGPGGSVRFGDAMMPHDYAIIVRDNDLGRACAVFHAFEQSIRDWLDGKQEMPEALRAN